MNPYWGQNFFEFFVILFKRLMGEMPLSELASDEVQLVVLLLSSISCSIIGTLLTLKKMTMLANSISHTILLGIVSACLIYGTTTLSLPILLIAAVLTALVTTLLTELLTKVFSLQEDASIGLVFTSLFALSIILVTLYTRSAHLGLEAVFGNIDALHVDDIAPIGIAALLSVISLILFYRPFQMAAFDPSLAATSGLSPAKTNFYLMTLTAITGVAAFRAVGVILVLAFIATPPVIARLWTHRLPILFLLSIFISMGVSIAGVALSRHILTLYQIPISTSGLITILMAFVLALSVLLTLRRTKGLMDRS
jgi:manganese/zinc/iron transport system permease protein